jgi:hypothetical protein
MLDLKPDKWDSSAHPNVMRTKTRGVTEFVYLLRTSSNIPSLRVNLEHKCHIL